MTQNAIRLSPSGPVIQNFTEGPLKPGTGARLRLTELSATMGGSLAVPITTPGVLNTDGFAGSAPIVCTMGSCDPGLNYRATLRLDLWNQSTNLAGSVVLFLDTSPDGTTWTNRIANGHKVQPQIGGAAADDGTAREVSLTMGLFSGNLLGITEGGNLKVRARAVCSANNVVLVDSLATVAGVSNLAGTIHLEIEECF